MANKNHVVEKRLILSIALNLFISILELIAGFLGNSLALISDAAHNFSDVFSLIASLFAVKISQLPNNIKQTFGYRRAEVLVALGNACLLIVVSIVLFKEAFFRLTNPHSVSAGGMIVFSTIAMFINGFCVIFLHEHSKKNINIQAAFFHLLSDTLTSAAVFIGGIIILYKNIYWVDSLLTLGITSYIFWQGYKILIRTVNILMHRTPEHINIEMLKNKIEKLPGIKNIHHLHIWPVTEEDLHFESHIELEQDMSVSETENLHQQIKEILADERIFHCTLQFECGFCDKQDLIFTKEEGYVNGHKC